MIDANYFGLIILILCQNVRLGTCVARIFRGWVHPGVDPGFLVRRDDGRGEGPKQGLVGTKRQGGWYLGRGAVAPPQDGAWGHCPRKFLKFNSQICALSL